MVRPQFFFLLSAWILCLSRGFLSPPIPPCSLSRIPPSSEAKKLPTSFSESPRSPLASLALALTSSCSYYARPRARTSTLLASSESSADSTESKSDQKSSVLGATFSLMKAMLGTGMLSLSSGLAATSDFPHMLWSANALMFGLGVLSAYTFWLYGRLAHSTGGKNLSDIWLKIYPQSSGRIVSWSNLIYCAGACLTFSLVLADSLTGVLRGLLPAAAASSWMASRQVVILVVTSTILWPLCNLPSLAALAPTSMVGVFSSLVAAVFVALRCPALVASSPYALKTGQFLPSLPPAFQPQFGTYNRLYSLAPLVLIAMGCVTWMAHFSAPEFYHSLSSKPKNDVGGGDDSSSSKKNNIQLRKYSTMTGTGFALTAVVNALMLSAGFLTFGGNCRGMILNNYAVTDLGATLARFLIAVSVTGSFPFLFSAARSSALSLLGRKESSSSKSSKIITPLLLTAITAIAMVLENTGFVVSLNGAVTGTAIIYIFPALLFLKQQQQSKRTFPLRLERLFCRGLLGFGAVSAVLGAATAVLIAYFPHLLR